MGKNIKFKFIKTCALKGVSSSWKGVELKLIKGGGSSSKGGSSSAKSRLGLVGIKFVVVAASKRMSKEYSCCSSTCRRNETPICHCGQRSMMRTANTMKNRGKHFWGCSKYKNGGEDGGCNFFKWCTDVGSEDSGRYVKSEGKKETLVISEELESTRKMIVTIQKSVFFLEKCRKGLILLGCFLCVIMMILVSILVKMG